MCIQSLQRKSISILIQKSSADIDQLAGRLGGNCYFYHLGTDGVTQSFLFTEDTYDRAVAEAYATLVTSPSYLSRKPLSAPRSRRARK